LSFKAGIYAGGLYAHPLLRGCRVQNLFGIAEHAKKKKKKRKKRYFCKTCKTSKTIAQNHVEHKRSRKMTSPKNAVDRAPSNPQFPC
jgi:hypothetical protein